MSTSTRKMPRVNVSTNQFLKVYMPVQTSGGTYRDLYNSMIERGYIPESYEEKDIDGNVVGSKTSTFEDWKGYLVQKVANVRQKLQDDTRFHRNGVAPQLPGLKRETSERAAPDEDVLSELFGMMEGPDAGDDTDTDTETE